MKIRKTAFARALEDWFQSEEGRRCVQGSAHGQYLENRLMRAFAAGWTRGRHAIEHSRN